MLLMPRVRPVLAGLFVVGAVALTSCGQEVSGEAQPVAGKADCDAAVMVVLDVSLSMEATDVAPSRLVAAKQAVRDFADGLPKDTRLGLVTFAGTASVQTWPDTDRRAFTTALESVKLAERTATGEGLYSGLSSFSGLPESEGPQRIILISDGKQTTPASLDDPRGAYTAARDAHGKNVRISTISLGTQGGFVEVPGSAGAPAQQVRVPTDPESLREIARLADGDFHEASSPEQLAAAFEAMTCS
ncbi:VWA domain-containing protein [Nocardia cyriacigeorgica]|uniref:VWA domain-containing protein n=2 Tax=Nocardia cyriacigeorgica TaxID=135487 RepID=A0A5R8PFM8_9NOCA|nr:VWA domain-containing protein [Nocardia cyriacigeorgica]